MILIYQPQQQNISLQVNDQLIGRKSSFKYHGSMITKNLVSDLEVRCLIKTGRTSFNRMSTMTNDNLSYVLAVYGKNLLLGVLIDVRRRDIHTEDCFHKTT